MSCIGENTAIKIMKSEGGFVDDGRGKRRTRRGCRVVVADAKLWVRGHVPSFLHRPSPSQVGLSLTTMSEYDVLPGGSLKLKRTLEDGGVKKCVFIYPCPSDFIHLIQHRKRKRKVDNTGKGAIQDEEPAKASPSGSNRNSPGIAGASDERKTAAEKRFQEVQRKRVRLFVLSRRIMYLSTCATQLADKVKKMAGKTHKDRVHELNAKLEALSEHHDIPKVYTTGKFSAPHLITSSVRWVLDKVGVEHSGVSPRSSFLMLCSGLCPVGRCYVRINTLLNDSCRKLRLARPRNLETSSARSGSGPP